MQGCTGTAEEERDVVVQTVPFAGFSERPRRIPVLELKLRSSHACNQEGSCVQGCMPAASNAELQDFKGQKKYENFLGDCGL